MRLIRLVARLPPVQIHQRIAMWNCSSTCTYIMLGNDEKALGILEAASLCARTRFSSEAQEPQIAVSRIEHGSHKVDGLPNITPHITRGGGTYGKTNGRSSICPSSDGSISTGQGAQQGSLDALASAVLGPEFR